MIIYGHQEIGFEIKFQKKINSKYGSINIMKQSYYNALTDFAKSKNYNNVSFFMSSPRFTDDIKHSSKLLDTFKEEEIILSNILRVESYSTNSSDRRFFVIHIKNGKQNIIINFVERFQQVQALLAMNISPFRDDLATNMNKLESKTLLRRNVMIRDYNIQRNHQKYGIRNKYNNNQ